MRWLCPVSPSSTIALSQCQYQHAVTCSRKGPCAVTWLLSWLLGCCSYLVWLAWWLGLVAWFGWWLGLVAWFGWWLGLAGLVAWWFGGLAGVVAWWLGGLAWFGWLGGLVAWLLQLLGCWLGPQALCFKHVECEITLLLSASVLTLTKLCAKTGVRVMPF